MNHASDTLTLHNGVEMPLLGLGVQPEGWSPFAEGRNDIFQDKLLSAIGKKYGKTPAQVILWWDIQRGVAAADWNHGSGSIEVKQT